MKQESELYTENGYLKSKVVAWVAGTGAAHRENKHQIQKISNAKNKNNDLWITMMTKQES